MRIWVAPLDAVEALVQAHKPERVASLLAPGQPGPRIDDRLHLRLDLHDVEVPAPGRTSPTTQMIERLVGFGLGAQGAVLVHCWLAISRSPAAAYILACAVEGPGTEDDLARRLRVASPECTPNRAMIALADGVLGREGRMIRAVCALGRGREATVGRQFTLDAQPRVSTPAPNC